MQRTADLIGLSAVTVHIQMLLDPRLVFFIVCGAFKGEPPVVISSLGAKS
ncbi:MAG: hypothetical protein LBB36_00950 [Fibromonadaceae bacterium]|nr:hypothetical protein [Fibromonadaceae bacterium]